MRSSTLRITTHNPFYARCRPLLRTTPCHHTPLSAQSQFQPQTLAFARARAMSSSSAPPRNTVSTASTAPRTSIAEFRALLSRSTRVLALCGAGLSASSGLPTFRGAGGLWRNHESTSLATPEAFMEDPALVWLFYAWRKHMALKARPNRGHYALAELAKRMEGERGFLCLTQNVDGQFVCSVVPPPPSFFFCLFLVLCLRAGGDLGRGK
ncbi:DHS-like NAD/FAD-binding domain-containing protein [Xylariomycetidae sp. FL2044]|nr:DHS-like NAD/FAD-binding domain-containing protein [Xylariomycetidae sp. FL2044]